ncbi:MAG: 50S ribosome-binding GTPase [Candidatus Woesebacteria bacterium]|jgi:GTP-binding protein
MIDFVKLTLIAGDGGHGKVSFRREKYVPKGGPDGGHGGDGGSIIMVGKKGLNTLRHFAGVKKYQAEDGNMGEKRKRMGAKGKDIILEVPLGTVIYLEEENQTSRAHRQGWQTNRGDVSFEKYYLAKEGQGIPEREEDKFLAVKVDESELTLASDQALREKPSSSQDSSAESKAKALKYLEILEDGQKIVLCQGGYGGRGNTSFKGPSNTTPLEAEYGTFGGKKKMILELKLLADVGLVGLPNAGKSTLLSKVTKARPKIAAYPFTTLEPNLGILQLADDFSSEIKKGRQRSSELSSKMAVRKQKYGEKRELVLADIPGLIEGASQGKGLGYTFLRHIENCKVLLFVLFLEETVAVDKDLTDQKKAEFLWQQFLSLKKELDVYSDILKQKKYILSLNKIDIYSNKLIDTIVKFFNNKDREISVFSAFTNQGLNELKRALFKEVG